MKFIYIFLISVVAIVGFGGCGKSAVKCDNDEAQKLVMDITNTEFLNQVARAKSAYKIGLATYDDLVKLSKDGNENAKKILEEVDEILKTSSPKLANIRTEKMDNELEKSECAADILLSDGYKNPITYKLQKTSEGKLYAEVFGLK